MLSNTRVAWFNGCIVPKASPDPRPRPELEPSHGASETTRTFNGAIVRLREHVDRFYRLLCYLRNRSPAQF